LSPHTIHGSRREPRANARFGKETSRLSQTISRFLWICAGGAVGTGARYLLSGWTLLLLGTAFPWGTLAVNVLGSFLVSALMHVALATKMIPPTLRLALTSGVLGGFTTYSTFNYETLEYLREGAWRLGLVNLIATVLLCLAAGVAGLVFARSIVGA
jgi:fluoride exporter